MSSVQTWIDTLVSTIIGSIETSGAMGSWKFYYSEDKEVITELIIYPTSVELIGGAVDGTTVLPSFSLNLQNIISVFDSVVDLLWYSDDFGINDDGGSSITIEGVFEGHEIWVKVQSESPEGEEPGFKLNVMKKR